jgi:uncharacterized protein (UPF0212 family)
MKEPQAVKKTPSKKMSKKPTSKQMAEHIASKRDQIAEAIHAVLNQHGLPAVSLHSMRLSIAPQDLGDSACPECAKNEHCVFDTDSGEWVCAPK